MIHSILFLLCFFGLLEGSLVFEQGKTQLSIPECPLTPDSVQVSNGKDFQNWTEDDQKDSFELINKIVQIWNGQGITDYLVFGKQETPFKWEVVPFPRDEWNFGQQFKVLWNITFGAGCLSQSEREALAQALQNKEIKPIQESTPEGNDPFENPEVIKSQLVYEGKEIYILYDYAPIEKLHFLIIPKKRHERISDLSQSEYNEAMQATQRLLNHYLSKNYTAFLFNKSGKRAGQTVPHWHEHIVFTDNQTDEWLAKLTILKNVLFGSSPLPKEELKERVTTLRKEHAEQK